MSLPKNIVDEHKRPIALTKILGRGGEGTVYEILGHAALAAKIYRTEKAAERREKILAMVHAQFHKSTSNVAYPISPLFHTDGTFAGFTMEKVGGRKPVHELYSPSSRRNLFAKADFRFLVRAALNVSSSVAAVHSTGCVIGDINHSGVLISQEAMASLIDADSFQFQTSNEMYRCTVGVPDFTPPELQGMRLDQVERSKNHDAFGLAVIIFNLLFMGRHPFVGGLLGGGDMPMETAIAEYRFAYSRDRSRTRMEPPPHVPSLDDLPLALARAFEASFGPSSAKGSRPTASDWCNILKSAEAEIVRCQSSSAHHYFKTAPNCPWCRMERGFPGFFAFSTLVQFGATTPSDLSQLISAIRAVTDPGQGQSLIACMPAVSVSATKSAPANDGVTSFATATIGALISIPLMTTQTIPPALALCAFAGCAYTAFRSPKNSVRSAKRSEILRSGFQKHDERYRTYIDNRKFSEIKSTAENGILQLNGLGSEQAKLIAGLTIKIRDAQLQRFLENHRLIHAKIKGIGPSKKATLRSYGVDSAADISKARVESISGFGPAASALLIDWRRTLEKKFTFNPSQPINPNDVAQIKTQIAQRRSQIENSLRTNLVELQRASSEIQGARSSIIGYATEIWKDLKQTEADEQATQAVDKTSKKRWLFTVLCAASLTGSLSINSKQRTTFSAHVAQTSTVTLPSPIAPTNPSPVVATPSSKNSSPAAPKLPVVPTPSPSILPTAPPLPPPIEITRVPTPPDATIESSPLSQESLSPQIISRRLADLGYLSASQSVNPIQLKQAIKDFKIVNHLTANDEIDAVTAQAINSSGARSSRNSFIGGWSTDESCAQGVQIEINSAQAKADGGMCKFNRFLTSSSGWKIQAKCQVGAKTWPANIALSLAGRQLSWSSEKGQEYYYRCR